MAEIQYLEINDITRMINVPANLLLGVREDKDVKKLYFKCKKIVEEKVDLSKHQIYVKYINALDKSGKKFDIMDPKICLCGDVTTQGDYITFSWLMSENVFAKAGLIAFSILASDGERLDGIHIQQSELYLIVFLEVYRRLLESIRISLHSC